MDQNNKNTFVAIALSVIVLLGWQFFYVAPRMEAERKAAEIEAQRSLTPTKQSKTTPSGQAAPGVSDLPQLPQNSDGQASELPNITGELPASLIENRETALAKSQRVAFENNHIIGSINLKAGRIDDMKLKDYRETIDKSSPLVTLLSPSELQSGYFSEFGFIASANSGDAPGPETSWTNISDNRLTPATPVTLQWSNAQGVTFKRTIKLDENYLFTFEDEVINTGETAISISPYGRVTRFGEPVTRNIFVLHEGPLGYFGEEGLQEVKYSDLEEAKQIEGTNVNGYPAGWIGITDKYWGTAIIPSSNFKPRFTFSDQGRTRYQADYLGEPLNVAPGAKATVSQRLFAGAKKLSIIEDYHLNDNILGFDKMIDWGWFYFITKPLAKLMNWLNSKIGNFGVAILVTTVLIKAGLFYFANLSYASMAKMKKMQPEMTKIKERFGDDKVKQQQEMMALYKKEKINPAAGCWPMLIQIPVFFALYKVIYVTIEMRHAPFFGWIQDLSAQDPTSVFNLFGLLPFDPPSFLMIGIWPLIMGVTMFLQMQMNPTPPDPTQAMIFKWMPIAFTFMLATFPAGLVIYWAWNNTLSIIQQGTIMKRHGVKVELFDNLKSLLGRKSPDEKAK